MVRTAEQIRQYQRNYYYNVRRNTLNKPKQTDKKRTYRKIKKEYIAPPKPVNIQYGKFIVVL